MTVSKHTANIRQRILGIIIIAALAVIFLPTLWQKANGLKFKVSHIPVRPTLPQVKQIKDVAPITFQQPEQAKGLAWSLNLATFAKLSNAQQLLKKLRLHGYPAYMQSSQMAVVTVYKVYVGPEVKQAKLQAAAEKLEKTLHLKGVMVSFTAIPITSHEAT